MQQRQISVIICTHNPRTDYLERVLEALKVQTFRHDEWELLLIDNASDEPLVNVWNLSWHPRSKHRREEELGLTPARLRGVAESCGKIIIFVDDDNVLDPTYVERAMEIVTDHPFLGAFSGTCTLSCDGPIEPWQREYFPFFCVREVLRPAWANFSAGESNPFGAGLVVRREVAERYASMIRNDTRRRLLDRRGSSLASAGDADLARTAHDLGLATGLFPQLKLEHLIPGERFSRDYLARLKRQGSFTNYLLEFIREGRTPPRPESLWTSPGRALLWLRMSPLQRAVWRAEQSARHEALAAVSSAQR